MAKAPKRTLQQRKTSEAILRLEFKQSKELSDVMREASQEVSDRLSKMPANATKSKRLKAVRSLFDDIEKTANKRMKAKGKLAESLTKGLEDSQKLTQEAAKIPNASVFNDFAPVLPVNALALVSSEFVERVESITDELKTRALRQTKLAMANGEGIEDIKRRLIGSGLRGDRGRDGVFRRARWRAEMLGRNTVNDLSNRGRMLGFQQLDKEFPELALRVRWSAATDSRTSDICEALNGQIRKLGENFSGGGVSVAQPPAHVNCRSAVVPVPEKYAPEFEESWKEEEEFTELTLSLARELDKKQKAKKQQGFLPIRKKYKVDKDKVEWTTLPDSDVSITERINIGSRINQKEIEAAIEEFNGRVMDISFKVNGNYANGVSRSSVKTAKAALRQFDKVIQEVEVGTMVYNDPVGGHGGHRSRIYARKGMGKTTKNLSRQWSIVREKEGKKYLHPINVSDPEEDRKLKGNLLEASSSGRAEAENTVSIIVNDRLAAMRARAAEVLARYNQE